MTFIRTLIANVAAAAHALYRPGLKLTVHGTYRPGHVSQFYGQGYTPIATLAPVRPKQGDYSVMLTVNGEWRFTIESDDAAHTCALCGTYRDPSAITPEVEAALGTYEGDGTFTHGGVTHRVDWRAIEGNWFEVFIDTYHDGAWTDYDFVVAEFSVGPTLAEMRAELERVLQRIPEEDLETARAVDDFLAYPHAG